MSEVPMEQQRLPDQLCAYLRTHFRCHTAILYGSRARGDWDAASDIDVIAFANAGEVGHIGHRWENLFLDLFLYASGTKPGNDWLRIHGGRVLFQRGAEGDEILAAVDAIFLSGPERVTPSEAQTTRLWLEKMLARAEKGDVEGNYRRHWLLKETFEIYFLLRGKWYLGPKKSFCLLQNQNPQHFEVFRRAFTPGASMADIHAAVALTNGPD